MGINQNLRTAQNRTDARQSKIFETPLSRDRQTQGKDPVGTGSRIQGTVAVRRIRAEVGLRAGVSAGAEDLRLDLLLTKQNARHPH